MRGGLQVPASFVFSQAIAAGATFNPLLDWQYEYPPNDSEVVLLERATAVGLVSAMTSGGDTIKQEAPVPSGGTAGQTPTVFTAHPLSGHAHGGLKLRVAYRNPTAGTITVDGVITVTPQRGGHAFASHLGGAAARGGASRAPARRIAGGIRGAVGVLRRGKRRY